MWISRRRTNVCQWTCCIEGPRYCSGGKPTIQLHMKSSLVMLGPNPLQLALKKSAGTRRLPSKEHPIYCTCTPSQSSPTGRYKWPTGPHHDGMPAPSSCSFSPMKHHADRSRKALPCMVKVICNLHDDPLLHHPDKPEYDGRRRTP
jgi:hypothetical protein